MQASIGGHSFCNGTLSGGVALSNLRYQGTRVVDEVVPVDAQDTVSIDRKGRKIILSFTVMMIHGSAAACETFITGLGSAIPAGSVVINSHTIGTGVCTRFASQQIGGTSITEYTLEAGGT